MQDSFTVRMLADSYESPMDTRNLIYLQGTHGTGKTGKMAKKNPCQGKHREFGNFAKTQGKHREFCLLKL